MFSEYTFYGVVEPRVTNSLQYKNFARLAGFIMLDAKTNSRPWTTMSTM